MSSWISVAPVWIVSAHEKRNPCSRWRSGSRSVTKVGFAPRTQVWSSPNSWCHVVHYSVPSEASGP